eukprot:1680435-Pyramimonas_sp.AAC.1
MSEKNLSRWIQRVDDQFARGVAGGVQKLVITLFLLPLLYRSLSKRLGLFPKEPETWQGVDLVRPIKQHSCD